MSTAALGIETRPPRDWLADARQLGTGFAARAEAYDRSGEFVKTNYEELREQRFFSAGIPGSLGGGGASHPQICAIIEELGETWNVIQGMANADETGPLEVVA